MHTYLQVSRHCDEVLIMKTLYSVFTHPRAFHGTENEGSDVPPERQPPALEEYARALALVTAEQEANGGPEM